MNEFLFKCFIIANSSQYMFKSDFYELKNKLLPQLAIYDGLDVQLIKVKCRSCSGTGQWGYWRWDGGEWCYSCNGTGVYRVDTHYLERWNLKGVIFHALHFEEPKFGELSQARPVIKGKIEHKDYGSKAGLIALFCLLFEYDIEKFTELAKRWAREKHHRMSSVFEKMVKQGKAYINEIDIKIGWAEPMPEDDLPF